MTNWEINSWLGWIWKGNSGQMSLSWNDRTNSTSRQNPSKVIRIHSTNLNPADIPGFGENHNNNNNTTGKLPSLITESLPFRTEVFFGCFWRIHCAGSEKLSKEISTFQYTLCVFTQDWTHQFSFFKVSQEHGKLLIQGRFTSFPHLGSCAKTTSREKGCNYETQVGGKYHILALMG